MVEFFVKRPVTTIMFILVFVVLGFVSLINLRVEKEPKIDFPIVTITATYPGATPLEVETLVINKIEDAVAELSEIKRMQSNSFENFGYVIIEFLMSSNINVKLIEVKDKVEAILNDLPDDIETPLIQKFDPLMTPVMDLVVSSENFNSRDLYEFADKKLSDKFSAIKGVANVEIYGGKERQIKVILDPMLMKQHYVTILDVIDSIKAKNKNIPGGLLEKGKTSLSLRFLGEFQNPKEIADLLIVSKDGTNFPLSEIAKIEDGFKKVETNARFNGKEVVGLSLTKVSDGNAVDISKAVKKSLKGIRSILPEGVTLDIATDTTDFIVKETNDTYINILIGIILTVVILYLFSGEIRLTFIASICIPTSIISTFFLMNASGFTINFMTLLAIATSLGTLIANSMVIIENILIHMGKGDSSINAAISGTKEVTTAVLASAGTNLVVFTPIAFMGGILGQFFKSFGLTIIYATLFSILASFTITPMLCSLLLKTKNEKGVKQFSRFNPFAFLVKLIDKLMNFLLKEYEKFFNLIFRFPKITVIVIFSLFMSLQFIMPYIGNEFYPTSDEDMITVKIEMPQGSTIEKTIEVTKFIENKIKSYPEVKSYLSDIGQEGVENSAIVVNLKPSKERKKTDIDIISELIPFTSKIPDVEIMLERGEARGGLDGDISINVHGIDYDKMIDLSRQMKQIMENTGYFRSVKSTYKPPKKEIRFIPGQKDLIQYGLQDVVVGNIIRSSIYGNDNNIYKEAGEEYKINVKLDDQYTQDIDDLKEINIISSKGMIPIVELGKLIEDKAMPQILHRDKTRVIQLNGYLSKSQSGYVQTILDKEFKNINFEPGYGYKYTGLMEHQAESANETGKAFLLAVILTFMLLCALMNSLLDPIPIIISIATSFIGVFYAMLFFESSINISSMLGMIMLVGLVVNNSILLLDYTILKMKEGVPTIQALWLAASDRFRVIIMTSLAIVLGIIPQLWAVMPVKVSMGVVMLGGMLASIFFTFLFTPVLFWYVDILRNKLLITKKY